MLFDLGYGSLGMGWVTSRVTFELGTPSPCSVYVPQTVWCVVWGVLGWAGLTPRDLRPPQLID